MQLATKTVKINWQCGGQGFEFPQLHPSKVLNAGL